VEGRGLSSRATQEVVRYRELGNLEIPIKVQELQEALHAKAKGSPDYRFYSLYDKLYRADVMAEAYRRSRENGGSAGVDGQRFEDIKKYGEIRWLDELKQELEEERYQAEAIRRVWIPKANGKLRPLGIATIRDRVVMTAMVLSWSQYSRPTCSQNSTPTVPGVTRSRPWWR